MIRILIGFCLFLICKSDKTASGRETRGVLLREDVTGTVKAEHYVYFQVEHPATIKLTLNSTAGDADLYLSATNQHPTFEFSDHDWSSTTCGIDGILLPKTLKKPIFIGVYGHPRFEVSNFVLSVTCLEDTPDPFEASVKPKKTTKKDPASNDSVGYEFIYQNSTLRMTQPRRFYEQLFHQNGFYSFSFVSHCWVLVRNPHRDTHINVLSKWYGNFKN